MDPSYLSKQTHKKHRGLSEKIQKRRDKEKEKERLRKSKSKKEERKRRKDKGTGKIKRRLKEFLDVYEDSIEDFIGLFKTLDNGGKVFFFLNILNFFLIKKD